jgi:hypothetical protein
MRSFREALEGEPLIAEFDTLQLATWMPDVLRWIARKVVDERKGYLLGCASKYLAKLKCCIHSTFYPHIGCTYSCGVPCF